MKSLIFFLGRVSSNTSCLIYIEVRTSMRAKRHVIINYMENIVSKMLTNLQFGSCVILIGINYL